MAEAPDDGQLMARYAAGDVAAFAPLYARHKGPLYRYFSRQCANPDNADELFQDVWVQVIKSRERYEPGARFAIYLYQLAHGCLVEHFRKSGHPLTDGPGEPGTAVDVSPIAEEVDPAFASARWSLVDWEQDPADSSPGGPTAGSVEKGMARLRSAFDALPNAQREAFLLHEEAQLGLGDIATVTGANAATVASRLRYAVQKLRVALGDPRPAAAHGTPS